MIHATTSPDPPLTDGDLFADGGECGAIMRALPWSGTSLGAVSQWPQSLRTCIRIILTSRQPMFVWWGPELINLYNDAYRLIVGGKHPQSLGQPASQVWREIWDEIGPRAESTMKSNKGTYDEALLLIMQRHGYQEETYYTFSYSPVPNDNGSIGGIICANTDETQRIINERRLAVLRELATKTAHTRTLQEACTLAALALGSETRDIPFSLIYLLDESRSSLRLAGQSGIDPHHPSAIAQVALTGPSHWHTLEALSTHELQIMELASSQDLPHGAWPRPPGRAVAVPIIPSGDTGLPGVLVIGLNPFQPFDERYRDFLTLVSGQIGASIAQAQAYAEERHRAEALAELDRAKTVFFSNVSHEFRTPLTLMLGPMEDGLSDREEPLPPRQRERQEIAHRNGLRLLKLVNSLLDFSRIEAGRMRASYEPVELDVLTRDLASTFRSAIERAGMALVVDCPPVGAPVYVDRDMWEKIVLNLLSNAYKHTFNGSITVRLERQGEQVVLSVADTGIGVAPDQVPRLFERFHRVHGARSRSHEGTGIGLALVQELAKLHGGEVTVQSQLDHGTTFFVNLHLGAAHLPHDQVHDGGRIEELSVPTAVTGEAPPAPPAKVPSSSARARAYVDEDLRWMASDSVREDPPGTRLQSATPIPVGRVLLADDNADMRAYVRKLLSAHWQVEVVADGLTALAAARERPPDLILSDVMMPGLDGFGLLRELRQDDRTRHIPVILLSARAGPEANIEGLAAGADDYLTKPFSAQELLARVRAHLNLKMLRERAAAEIRDRERLLRFVTDHARIGLVVIDQHRHYQFVNPAYAAQFDLDAEAIIGRHISEIRSPIQDLQAASLLSRAFFGERVAEERRVPDRSASGERIYSLICEPSVETAGVQSVVVVVLDITSRKLSEEALRASEERFRSIIGTSLAGIAEVDLSGRFLTLNDRFCQITGRSREALLDAALLDLAHPSGREPIIEQIQQLRADGRAFELETRFTRADGSEVWVHNSVAGIRDAQGQVARLVLVSLDISSRKAGELSLRLRSEQYATLLNQAPLGVYLVDSDFRIREMNPLAMPAFAGIPGGPVGRDFAEVVAQIRNPEYVRELIALFRHTLETGEPYATPEQYSDRRDRGVELYYDWRIDRIALPEGGYGVVCYFKDVTQQVHARQVLAQHAAELRRANVELEHFASIASHDLQAPLRMITIYSDVLRTKYEPVFDARARGYFDKITAGTEAMRALTRSILNYSQVGRQGVPFREVAMATIVAETLEILQERIQATGAVIRCEPLPVLLGDADRLRQLFQNLLANGLKFVAEGRTPVIAITAKDEGQLWAFSVADNGIGIPESARDRIFQIFQRLHPKTEYPGSGIGLATCKKIVEQHGGRIEVESQLGQGSTFHFTLAKQPPEPGAT